MSKHFARQEGLERHDTGNDIAETLTQQGAKVHPTKPSACGAVDALDGRVFSLVAWVFAWREVSANKRWSRDSEITAPKHREKKTMHQHQRKQPLTQEHGGHAWATTWDSWECGVCKTKATTAVAFERRCRQKRLGSLHGALGEIAKAPFVKR